MKADTIAVLPNVSIENLVKDYVYRYHYKLFPVVDNDKLIGCVTPRQIKEVLREDWAGTKVGDIAEGCTDAKTISPETDAVEALKKMHGNGSSRLMVVDEKDKLVGIISLKDIMNWLSFKIDLE